MTTFKNSLVGAGVALIALVSLALPVAPVFAADFGDDGGYSPDTSYGGNYYPDTVSNYYPDTSSNYYPDTSSNYYPDTTSNYYPDTVSNYYPDTYAFDDSSSYANSGTGYSAPTFGGSGSGFSMPSFGGSTGGSSYPVFSSAANQAYRQTIIPTLPSYAQAQASVCSAVNSCNSTYTDNSVYAPDNSYTDNSVYSAPTTVTVTAPTTVTTDSHNQQISYAQPQKSRNDDYSYDYPTYRQPTYQQPSYPAYQQPVAYNTTPYITLSQAPYTGLDLGPMGEVLYWTFLVLWCLGAAYLIVVKRVQNKLVAFLNGFLFGTSQKTAVHTTHAPQAHVASATLVEEGIDPFIQAQIKRA